MIYSIGLTTIDGQKIELARYRGQVLLIVNIASQCGFVSQLQGLETLYQRYRQRGFAVLGFPSNDFFGQEPFNNQEIGKFCSLQYDVTFPLFEKAPVSGAAIQPLFKLLTDSATSEYGGRVWWNFEKFLVGRDGAVRGRFRSITSPLSTRLVRRLEELLEESSVESSNG